MTAETVGLLWLNSPYDNEATRSADEEQGGKVFTTASVHLPQVGHAQAAARTASSSTSCR